MFTLADIMSPEHMTELALLSLGGFIPLATWAVIDHVVHVVDRWLHIHRAEEMEEVDDDIAKVIRSKKKIKHGRYWTLS